MAARQPRFNQHLLIDTTPLPDDIPKVKEIGASSAPLMSASFFIGARCQPYNDDYMKCKDEANGRGELDCMGEGRKVTRCAASVLSDINTHCLAEFRKHWQCLEEQNQQLWQCRKWEWPLNKCVFAKLQLEKKIPGTPEGEVPVHLRRRQAMANPFGLSWASGPVPILSADEHPVQDHEERKKWLKEQLQLNDPEKRRLLQEQLNDPEKRKLLKEQLNDPEKRKLLKEQLIEAAEAQRAAKAQQAA